MGISGTFWEIIDTCGTLSRTFSVMKGTSGLREMIGTCGVFEQEMSGMMESCGAVCGMLSTGENTVISVE